RSSRTRALRCAPLCSACTRFGVFAAGIASAEDPVHTVGPQREAAEQRSQRSQ
ncbi:polysulfide reductase, partial [Streptomyces sp. NPDC048430]